MSQAESIGTKVCEGVYTLGDVMTDEIAAQIAASGVKT